MKRLLSFVTAVLISSALFAQTSGGPDAYGYTWKNSNHTATPPVYQWFDITTTGIEVGGLSDDNIVGPFSASQGFQFYWYPTNQFWISSNGFISFSGVNDAAAFPSSVPTTTDANDWIAPLMADLNFDGLGNTAKCYYWSNADTLCVSYLNVPFYTNNAAGYSGSNTFQIILNKADKSITFNYQATNIGSGTLDIVVGIENSTGTLGLGPMIDIMPAGNFTIKFYYPSTVTYAVTDGGMEWNGNEKNGGIFIKNGGTLPLKAMVRNTGNQVLSSFTVRDTVIQSTTLAAITSGSSVVPAGLAAQATSLVTFPNSFTPASTGTYQLNTSISGITGDMVASNDRKTQEIIVVDTTLATMTLDYSNGVAGGGGLSWTGGNGGIAIYVEPPVYPVKVSGSRFLITSNASAVGFYAKIYRDNGPNKSPGTLLDSVYVGSTQITTGTYTMVTTANSNIYIDSGGVYLAWIMAGTDINIGRDNTPPVSYRTYEVLFNSWADYRDKFIEDFCLGLIVAQPVPATDFTVNNSSDPTFAFTDISTYNPTSWAWDFGDGGTSNLQNPSHTYTTTGQKTVCLTAGNAYGTNQKCKPVYVGVGAPVADFTINGTNNPTFLFTDISAYYPTTWAWDFGDGGTSSIQNPTHTYTTAGQKNVCLTSANTHGSNQKCKTLTVNSVTPTAMFTFNITAMPTVDFTDASTGAPNAWKWDFDDTGADSSNLQNPTYVFKTNGNHNVCLTVTNSFGTSTPYCQIVTITGIGIDENDKTCAAAVFPNPATDRFTISVENHALSQEADFRIFDVAGREIPVTYSVKDHALDVSCGNLAKGVYFYTLNDSNVPSVKGKVLVQ